MIIETLAILTIMCGLYVFAGVASRMLETYSKMKDQRAEEEDIW
jgi:hypothetical protein